VAKTFNCPNCGAPLDYKETGELTLRCPFCSNSVIVPEELRTPPPAAMSPSAPDTPTDAVMDRLKNLASTATSARQLRQIARAERRIERRQARDDAHRQRRDIGK
jgi:uncharacterized Zn finger protein (UPF0148 family)